MGQSRRNAIDIEADLTNGYKATGFVQGFMESVNSDRWTIPLVEYVHGRMAEAFDTEIDAVARTGSMSLGHVYEWRMTGIPQGRLWRHTLNGRGANRQASWQWLPSIQPILTPEERQRAGNPNDPITNVSEEDIQQLSDRDYFFTWKAQVNEYSLPVNIVAVNTEFLFVPTFGAENGFRFAKATRNQMKNAGAGQFTLFWTTWWSKGAQALWSNELKRAIEKDLGRSEKEMSKTTKTAKRTRMVGFSTISDNAKAFEAGKNYARAYIQGKAKSYAQASKYIDRYGQFGDEVFY